jgi:sterol desaturase/sphingolipid hydroxylase (fatty acid hydroxylase superfamily)
MMISIDKFIEGLLTLFYMVPPSKLAISEMAEVPKFVTNAVPYFFFLMALECFVAYLRGYKAYFLKDTLMSVSLGAVQQVFGIWVKALSIVPYTFLYEHFRLFDIPVNSMVSYVGFFLGVDFCYYWFHRYAHEFHFMWAGHFVHHSGQHYNLATALRQGSLQSVSSWTFYLILAVLGFHPAAFATHAQLNLLAQFWIHTEMVGKLGFLEWIINTPSHHRMHHRPPGNCNYAAVFIIWDRMFGTFRVEDKQRAYYGLAKPLTNFDPVDANKQHWVRMQNIKASGGPWGLVQRFFTRRVTHPMQCDLSVFFTNKDFENATAAEVSAWKLPEPATEARTKNELSTSDGKYTVYAGLPLTLGAATYITAHFILMLLFCLMLTDKHESMSFRQKMGCSLYAFASMSILGRVYDGEAVLLELVRVVFTAAVVVRWTDNNPFFGGAPVFGRWLFALGLLMGWMACLDSTVYPPEHREAVVRKTKTAAPAATPLVEEKSPKSRSGTPARSGKRPSTPSGKRAATGFESPETRGRSSSRRTNSHKRFDSSASAGTPRSSNRRSVSKSQDV